MKRLTFLSLMLFILPVSIIAQQNKFDSIFNMVSNETIRMKWAINIADSLYIHSENEEQKTRSSMLSASLLYRSGMINEALEKAKISNEIAENANLYALQARVCGLLSTIYRVSGLHAQGKVYLEKALKASEKIKREADSFRFQGNLHQEMAYYAMDEMNFSEAVDVLKKGMTFFEKLPNLQERSFFIASNEEILAKNYVSLGQYELALQSYENALLQLEKSGQESALRGFIHNGIGKILLLRNEFENSINHFNEALEIAEASEFLALQEEVYLSLIQYYKQIKNQEKYVEFSEKHLALQIEREKSRNLQTNNFVAELQTREKSAVTSFYTIVGFCFILIILGLLAFLYIKRKRKTEIDQFKKIIRELNEKSLIQTKEIHDSPAPSTTKTLIPSETEEKLLERLNKFEKTKKYLEKGFTLPMLAVELETNTKYLSRIINNHRKSDFNTYINRLKIEYIIRKLHDEPIYASYKISYLAEECGFSSHSKFTTVFKNATGVSPTTFLSLLEKERNKTKTQKTD